jgi:hypothetical protein
MLATNLISLWSRGEFDSKSSVVYLIPLGLPAFGAVVREFARALAAYNAPARATMWLARPFPKFPPF